MLDLLEKAVMTAIGAAAITQKKAEELVVEIREKYTLSEEEGRNVRGAPPGDRRGRQGKDQGEWLEVEVKKVVERLGLVSREEHERLAKRVQELESRLNG